MRSSRGAARERGGADGGVCVGGGGLEWRVNGELELTGVRVAGGGVLGFWGGELVRERGDWVAGLPLVLKRARDGEPGLFPELATATTRWRPRSSTGVAWRGKEAPAWVGVGPGGRGGAACGGGAAGGGLPALPRQRRRRSAPAAEEAERERGGRRELDYFTISEKFRGPIVKQK